MNSIYKNNVMHIDNVSIDEIAKKAGSPTYIYSKKTLMNKIRIYNNFIHKNQSHKKNKIYYAVKANSNLAILKCLVDEDTGFDIVSGGELERVLIAGGKPENIVFSGVGKTLAEINRALDVGIHCFNVESEMELQIIKDAADIKHKIANISIRVNPDVDAKTHPFISTGLLENKFGVDFKQAKKLYELANKSNSLKILGVSCHIGSQIKSLEPFVDAIDKVLLFVDELKEKNIKLEYIDMGGGLAISYDDTKTPSIEDYIQALLQKMESRNEYLILEPGRSVVGKAGILLAKVLIIKKNGEKKFAVIDAGMNDLMRPSLYGAEHQIKTVVNNASCDEEYTIVGPVCETSDIFSKSCNIQLYPGSFVAIMDVGAYGMSMVSNYNTRFKPAEVLVDGNSWNFIRKRETIDDALNTEKLYLPGE